MSPASKIAGFTGLLLTLAAAGYAAGQFSGVTPLTHSTPAGHQMPATRHPR